MNAPPPALPLYLGEGADSTFGLLHLPPSDSTSTLAVLICPPFGWEDICSYRSRRGWAEQLAAAGHFALRIDLPGTGDSPGTPRDQGRLSAWTGAILCAATRLRAIPACERVAAIGIGLGGLMICRAIATDAPIDDVILWAVPSRGRTLLRELHMFARLEDSAFDAPAGQQGSPLPDGYTGMGGFVLSGETVKALEELDVATLALPRAGTTRALLLERDGIAVDGRLNDHLERAGMSVTITPGPGYGAMMTKPHLARSPTEVIARVLSWLEEPPTSCDASASIPPVASTHPMVKALGASDADSTQLAVAGAAIHETPLRFEQPFGDLFAIFAEPVETQPVDLCLVMLNAGAIRRIGPNRMWVETARRWAARGVPTLRLDLEGIGDADGDGERFTELAELYVPGLVDQARAALDAIEARGAGHQFMLAGLCSGAYWAFQGALSDDRVVAALMLNPRALFWDPSLEISRDFRRGALRVSSWGSVLHGEVPAARIGAFLRQAPLALPQRALARWHSHRAGDRAIPRALDQLREADKQIRFVFSGNEPLYEELEMEGLLDQLDRWPNVSLDLIPGTDHTLRPFESQQAAHEAIDRALNQETQRIASRETDRNPMHHDLASRSTR